MFVNTVTTRGVLRSFRTYVKHRKYYADYMEGRNVQPSNVEFITIPASKKHLLTECYIPIYNEEPCNSTIGYDIVKHRDEYMRLFTEKIYRHNSPQIAAWNHQTQKVVGIQLTKLYTKNEHIYNQPTESESKGHYLDDANLPESVKIKTKIMLDYFHPIEDKYANPDVHGVQKTIYLNSLRLSPEYRHQGLATKLVEEAVRQCQQSLDIKVFVTLCTSARSLNILKSVGFEQLRTKENEKCWKGIDFWVLLKRVD